MDEKNGREEKSDRKSRSCDLVSPNSIGGVFHAHYAMEGNVVLLLLSPTVIFVMRRLIRAVDWMTT